MPRALACPACGAALREGAPWCTLCYADLRPGPHPVPVIAPATAAYGVAAPDPLTAPLLDVVLPQQPRQQVEPAAPDDEPRWPCTRCGERTPLSLTACTACGARFLDAAHEAPSLVLPVVGDVLAMSRARRMLLALAAVLALCLPLALVTLLLTDRPATTAPSSTTQVTSTP